MLSSQARRSALLMVLSLVASTGCGGGGPGAPLGASAPLTSNALGIQLTHNISGQYAGDVKDGVFGDGQIYAELVEYQDSIGGTLTFVYGSTVFITPATFLVKGSTLTGRGQIGKDTGGTCAASETMTYASHKLKGSYAANRGCSNDTGSFTMNPRCRYTVSVTGPEAALKRCSS